MHIRETGLAPAPHREIMDEVNAAANAFRPRRQSQAVLWYDLDILVDSHVTDNARWCPTLVEWLRTSVPWTPNRVYIARLDPGGEVFWHADFQDPEIFSEGFVLALRIPHGSFVEFADGTRYVYAEGTGYHARLGVLHRAVNPTTKPRFTAFVGSPKR